MSDLAPSTHIAGMDLIVAGHRQRQRCGWCGAVLIDNDLRNISVQLDHCATCNVDGDGTAIYPAGQGAPDCPTCGGSGYEPPQRPAVYPVGRLVRVDGGGGFRMFVVLDETDQLPDDCCAMLDDEVTG